MIDFTARYDSACRREQQAEARRERLHQMLVFGLLMAGLVFLFMTR